MQLNDHAHVVLDSIGSPPQRIILQIQDLEPSVHIFDELADLKRTLVVA
jgi:hypothetical protein